MENDKDNQKETVGANELQELQDRLSDAETAGQMEKFLKNEAYAFLLAEGLSDKFLKFRSFLHRTGTEETVYNLVMEADKAGLWLDL